MNGTTGLIQATGTAEVTRAPQNAHLDENNNTQTANGGEQE